MSEGAEVYLKALESIPGMHNPRPIPKEYEEGHEMDIAMIDQAVADQFEKPEILNMLEQREQNDYEERMRKRELETGVPRPKIMKDPEAEEEDDGDVTGDEDAEDDPDTKAQRIALWCEDMDYEEGEEEEGKGEWKEGDWEGGGDSSWRDSGDGEGGGDEGQAEGPEAPSSSSANPYASASSSSAANPYASKDGDAEGAEDAEEGPEMPPVPPMPAVPPMPDLPAEPRKKKARHQEKQSIFEAAAEAGEQGIRPDPSGYVPPADDGEEGDGTRQEDDETVPLKNPNAQEIEDPEEPVVEEPLLEMPHNPYKKGHGDFEVGAQRPPLPAEVVNQAAKTPWSQRDTLAPLPISYLSTLGLQKLKMIAASIDTRVDHCVEKEDLVQTVYEGLRRAQGVQQVTTEEHTSEKEKKRREAIEEAEARGPKSKKLGASAKAKSAPPKKPTNDLGDIRNYDGDDCDKLRCVMVLLREDNQRLRRQNWALKRRLGVKALGVTGVELEDALIVD
eukprot:TRINITY_DN26617_c0_g1_i1.p1 TRINITY_DN26617_c0_g1~~TRINITY_DN26617_c0_g1_i1.p1  ORF type:complete len:504 (+),score=157.00 TRINITY_DN26617_c0_g1_i1:103-1614(+)